VSVSRDAAGPVVVAPAARLIGQMMGTRTMVARLGWSATDAGSGVASYRIQTSVNGGAFSTITTPSTATAISRTLTDGATYRFRVRATDREGNTSAWVYGPTFTARRLQETNGSLAYTGNWRTATSSSLSGRPWPLRERGDEEVRPHGIGHQLRVGRHEDSDQRDGQGLRRRRA
jgi:hypothetical protein